LRFYDLSHPRGRSAPLWPISLTLRSKEGRIMKQSHVFFLGKALLLLAVLVLLPACSGPSQGSAPGAPKEILLGASLPESGALAGFGVYLKWSYTTAINEVNKAGGLYLSQYKTKVPVRLIIYDDQSLP